ncbi:MAG: hypothetical protein IJ146_01035 [Kiritimatiellae bacterium]|nr:hypothetical protein [Kiritimatiellia bacterium]
MKKVFLICCIVGFTTMAEPLPQPEFADAGACANVALSALSASGELSFSLSFAPGSSNNVEVAFGADLDGDGKLSPDERRMEAGWDRGAWFMCDAGGEMVMQMAQPSGSVAREFRWSLRLKRGRVPTRLSATVDGAPLFYEVASAPPGWLYEPEWNMACVIVRGAGVGGEMGEVKATIDGTVLKFR